MIPTVSDRVLGWLGLAAFAGVLSWLAAWPVLVVLVGTIVVVCLSELLG